MPDGAIDDAVEDEQREQHRDPGHASRQVAPPPRLLAEDPLVDQLKRAHDSHNSAKAEQEAGQDRLDAMRRCAAKERAHDVRALAVEPDVAAEVVVDPLVGE